MTHRERVQTALDHKISDRPPFQATFVPEFAERLKKEFPRITLPVFILHGTADKATVPSGSQFFYDTVGSKDKKLKLYEGHFHDLLNDIGKEEVMADIQAWIEKHL